MNRVGVIAAIAALVAALAPAPARAQASDGDTPPDTTASERKFLSTDGAVSVFEEAKPGEGIEGYWWEYDGSADLSRLLDDDRRTELLDPLTDAFGFTLVMPESILVMRDSVKAVADSILAERIDFKTSFDPKLKTTYDQTKDTYGFKNVFDASLPMTSRGSITAKTKSDLSYNKATRRSVDSREVTSTFTYRFQPNVSATATIGRTDDVQERAGVTDSDRNTNTFSGSMRLTRVVRGLELEGNGGFSLTAMDYRTTATDGSSSQLSPNWNGKIARPYPGGRASLTYTGNVGRSSRKETISVLTDSLDQNNQLIEELQTNEADEQNYKHALSASLNHDFSDNYDVAVNGNYSTSQFQFLSQKEEFRGQQETRSQAGQSLKGTLNAIPFQGFTIKAIGDYSRNENLLDLDTNLSKITTLASSNVDLSYKAWKGGDFVFKMERKHEDRDYNTIQAGTVDGYKFSADYKQDVTANISFDATYFVTLDRFAFDDPDSNKGDRDLRNRRTNFIVRYNPKTNLKMDVRMEVRENESINIHRSKSGDNKTDFAYLITPTYTWTVGNASLSGDFTADVRYSVFDFREDDNTLIRRFSTRQKWLHSFSDRLSTSLLWTYEFNDQGTYSRNLVDGRRRFGRVSELFRRRIETEILYKPRPFLDTKVQYRWDGDDTYRIAGADRTFSGSRRTQQFTYGITLRRQFMKHVKTNIRFSHTLKNGDTVGAFDRNFYTVLATVEYQPFKKPGKNGGGGS